ncbi:hypothetical protein Btru_064867 [Bulinus truncatus]|nr:hypothetical protein Btru_064867 [Bulinus truncatus]
MFPQTPKVIFFIISTINSRGLIEAELYSSVAKIKEVIDKERQLINHLELVLNISQSKGVDQAVIQKLRRKLMCVNEVNSVFKDGWDVAECPMAGFKYLKRVHYDWRDITEGGSQCQHQNSHVLDDNLRSMYDVMGQWRMWPTEQDIKGAALGLVRLGHMYNVFPMPRWLKDTASIHTVNASRIDTQASYRVIQLSQLMPGTNLHNKSKPQQDVIPNIGFLVRSQKPNATKRAGHAYENSYLLFSEEDLIQITRTALANQLHEESRRWLALLQTVELTSGLSEHDELKDLIMNEEKMIIKETQGLDDIKTRYIGLCRTSLLAKLGPSGQMQSCYWTYSWPYVRYNSEYLHQSPDIIMYHNVITDTEIEYLMKQALNLMEPSLLPVNSKTQNRGNLLRVSQTAWMYDTGSVLRRLSQRVGDITGLYVGQTETDTPSEPFQVVNYGLGGMYAPHQDSVKVSRANGRENIPSLRHAGDRLATWMYYLSDVILGGATVFPLLNLTVTPLKGSAVLWYNLQADGTTDNRMIHGACPVLLGDKWVANKWIREAAQIFHHPCHNLI